MNIRVALVEDSASLRKRFAQHFALLKDIKLIAAYGDGESAIRQLRNLPNAKRPHIVLMDIGLPNLSGIETTIALKELYPEMEIMMVTVFEDEEKIFQSIQAGAAGYMLKDDSINGIEDGVRELARGGAPMSQSIARKVLSFIQSKEVADQRKSDSSDGAGNPVEFSLSTRELELLEGLVRGETYSTLAKQLFISPHTVKTHIKNIYKKLHVHSRALAVRVALERKLV